jgi:hypothetical protein
MKSSGVTGFNSHMILTIKYDLVDWLLSTIKKEGCNLVNVVLYLAHLPLPYHNKYRTINVESLKRCKMSSPLTFSFVQKSIAIIVTRITGRETHGTAVARYYHA